MRFPARRPTLRSLSFCCNGISPRYVFPGSRSSGGPRVPRRVPRILFVFFPCWAAAPNCWAAARLCHSSQLLGSSCQLLGSSTVGPQLPTVGQQGCTATAQLATVLLQQKLCWQQLRDGLPRLPTATQQLLGHGCQHSREPPRVPKVPTVVQQVLGEFLRCVRNRLKIK